MSPSPPRPDPEDGRASDEQRSLRDDKVEDDRARADREREERRALHDRTRQHERGGSQSRAGLERERAVEDAEREQSRALEDRLKTAERRSADRASAEQAADLAEQAADLAEAEQRLDEMRVDEVAAASDRRGQLRAAREGLDCLRAALEEILRGAAGQPGEAELAAGVGRARSSADRIGLALAAALDAEDVQGRHHDIGGSG